MTPADILASLFPGGHDIRIEGDRIEGHANLPDGRPIHVLGIANGAPLGIEDALHLAGKIIKIARSPGAAPILLLVDSGSQRMSRHDELLGLNEYLAHLAKTLDAAERAGHRTIGLLYGHSAAGAFIATAMAAGTLVALPGAVPEVMDLPSMSRVTKLPLDKLQEMATATAVFAPGLENMVKTGAVAAVWDDHTPLAPQLAALLATVAQEESRDRLGQLRAGRPMAAEIAAQVQASVRQHG